ncbi:MAG: glutamate--tRNA ligase [Chloroflexi bacterium]|nr:MAG: glutamate--tRNA ligase [Chloroflexota bacterium]
MSRGSVVMTEHTKPARVRFAPSPTGFLHLGGLRTALFDWLYARHTGGQFILRIEDTDQKRYNPQSLKYIMRGLRWLGLEWDEGPDIGGPYGPYVQSERKAIYRQYAEQLLAGGHAYKSYTPVEAWEEANPEDIEHETTPRKPYDRRDRFLTAEQRAVYEAEGRPYAIRFAAPLEGTTTIHDLIRGEITWKNNTLIDQVLLKSDGMPTYHLAMVVDDHLMQITHVLRGEEWLPSAPIHKLLFNAFGWEMPQMIHLPVILNPNGKGKMSKRKQVVDGKEYLALVHEFIDAGYLPEAMFNFLANLGWNFDAERELFTPEEAIERFDVAAINPKPAVLPYAKLEWLNGVYIRNLAPEELHRRLAPYLSTQLGLDEETLLHSEQLSELIPLIQERIKLLTDAAEFVDWAFHSASEISYPNLALFTAKQKLTLEQAADLLRSGATTIANLDEFTVPALEQAFRLLASEYGLKIGPFLTPFRVAITGKEVAPPLFESMVVLGRSETLARLHNALAALQEALVPVR